MFGWFRSSSSRKSGDQPGGLRRDRRWGFRSGAHDAGYYAVQDPYGSALDDFDEQCGLDQTDSGSFGGDEVPPRHRKAKRFRHQGQTRARGRGHRRDATE